MQRIRKGLDRFYRHADRRLGGRLTILVKTALAFDQDNGAVMSRSIAYYALFSLFPLLLLLMTFASSVLASEEAQELVLSTVERIVPLATDSVAKNIQQVLDTRNTIGILASVGLLWSASGVFTAIYRSVNLAWGNPKSQLFWREKLYGLAVVLLFGLLLMGMTVYTTVANLAQSWQVSFWGRESFLDSSSGGLVSWASGVLPSLVSIVAFMVLYRTMPRNQVAWRDVWLGGLIAGVIWEAARWLYSWYLVSFARYSLIYGSVGAIIGFLLWSYLSAMIVLVGAEFTAQHTYWRRAGRPVESRLPSQWIEEWSK